MKVGAILLPRLKRSGAIHRDNRFRPIEGIKQMAFIKVVDKPRSQTIMDDPEMAIHRGNYYRQEQFDTIINKYNLAQE